MSNGMQALKDAYCRHLLHPDEAAQRTAEAYAATILAAGESLPACDVNWVDITLRDATKEQLGIIPTLPDYNPITGMGYKQDVGFKWPWDHNTVEDLEEHLGIATKEQSSDLNINWGIVALAGLAGITVWGISKL